jgi:hypothetical protein
LRPVKSGALRQSIALNLMSASGTCPLLFGDPLSFVPLLFGDPLRFGEGVVYAVRSPTNCAQLAERAVRHTSRVFGRFLAETRLIVGALRVRIDDRQRERNRDGENAKQCKSRFIISFSVGYGDAVPMSQIWHQCPLSWHRRDRRPRVPVRNFAERPANNADGITCSGRNCERVHITTSPPTEAA